MISFLVFSFNFNHFQLFFRLTEQGVPGIEGIDTRQLTKIIREKGSMLGKIVVGDLDPKSVAQVDPASLNLVKEVSIKVEQNYFKLDN